MPELKEVRQLATFHNATFCELNEWAYRLSTYEALLDDVHRWIVSKPFFNEMLWHQLLDLVVCVMQRQSGGILYLTKELFVRQAIARPPPSGPRPQDIPPVCNVGVVIEKPKNSPHTETSLFIAQACGVMKKAYELLEDLTITSRAHRLAHDLFKLLA